MAEIISIGARLAGTPFRAASRQWEPGDTKHDILAELLADIARGSDKALAHLYERTSGRLLALATGIVGRPDLAEDVLQDSFVRIWRSAHRYDSSKGSALAWLTTILRNRAFSARAMLGKQEARRDDVDLDILPAAEKDPIELIKRSQEARRVHECLQRLSSNQRQSLLLVYFEGLTHQTLADRLGVPLGTAKSWVRRGLAQIGRCLTNVTAPGWRELVAGEYALGSLQGRARSGFERRRQRDARFCVAADAWETYLAALVEFLPEKPVPARVWRCIQSRIAGKRPFLKRSDVLRVAVLVLGASALMLAIAYLR